MSTVGAPEPSPRPETLATASISRGQMSNLVAANSIALPTGTFFADRPEDQNPAVRNELALFNSLGEDEGTSHLRGIWLPRSDEARVGHQRIVVDGDEPAGERAMMTLKTRRGLGRFAGAFTVIVTRVPEQRR